jgi:hypothetical protein
MRHRSDPSTDIAGSCFLHPGSRILLTQTGPQLDMQAQEMIIILRRSLVGRSYCWGPSEPLPIAADYASCCIPALLTLLLLSLLARDGCLDAFMAEQLIYGTSYPSKFNYQNIEFQVLGHASKRGWIIEHNKAAQPNHLPRIASHLTPAGSLVLSTLIQHQSATAQPHTPINLAPAKAERSRNELTSFP